MITVLPILAETTADPGWSFQMQLWIAMAFSVGSCAATIYSSLWGKTKTVVQQPLRVEWEKEFATKDELHETGKRIEDLEKSVAARFDASALAGSQSREKLDGKVSTIGETTAGLKATMEVIHAQMIEISRKIDRLQERGK